MKAQRVLIVGALAKPRQFQANNFIDIKEPYLSHDDAKQKICIGTLHRSVKEKGESSYATVKFLSKPQNFTRDFHLGSDYLDVKWFLSKIILKEVIFSKNVFC